VRALVKARPDLTLSDLGRELAGLAIKGWDQSQPFVGRQVSAPRGVDVQNTPNSSALTSRGPAPHGSKSKNVSIRAGWRSSTRVCCRAQEGEKDVLISVLLREAAQKMGDGPPGSAFRGGSQTGPSGGGKEPLS